MNRYYTSDKMAKVLDGRFTDDDEEKIDERDR